MKRSFMAKYNYIADVKEDERVALDEEAAFHGTETRK
jgi:hypothetical protein